MIEVKYNIEVEVTIEKLKELRTKYSDIIAYRTSGKKYYIKVLIPRYVNEIKRVINAKM